jgi:predicted MPP superfamily phosphohydrolase
MTDILNILHITDLHYTKRSARNRDQDIIISALLDDVEHLTLSGLKPDLIIFSGDLVNDADEDEIYWSLFENFIEPLLKKCRLTGENLLVVPGNHDAMRSAVKKHAATHREFYNRYDNELSNEYYLSDNFKEINSDKFRTFNEFIELSGAKQITESGFSLIDMEKLGIAACIMNTAISSAGGLPDVERDDYGKLLLPSYLTDDVEKALSNYPDRLKILIGHHPSTWLKEDCSREFDRFSSSLFDALFMGHIHQTNPTGILSSSGNALHLQTGALHQGNKKWNGYTVVRVAPAEKHFEVLPRRFALDARKFVSAAEIGENGRFYASDEAKSFWKLRPALDKRSISEWISGSLKAHFLERHEETLVGKSLGDVFHEHPMRSKLPNFEKASPQDDESNVDFPLVCAAAENFLIIGETNFGKSTLIKRIGLEYINNSDNLDKISIPALFDFKDISLKGESVLKAVRAATPGLDQIANLRDLLSQGTLTVLVDDVDPSDFKRFESLVEFTCVYPRCRYIFTSKPADGFDIAVAADLNRCVSFKEVMLLPLKTQGIRAFTQRYSGDDPENCDRLVERIVSILKQAALPPTAFTVSVLLEVFGSLRGDILINEVTLVERFIEYLLAKEKTSEATRATFNFGDKTRCLGYVAKHMAYNGTYELNYDELLSLVDRFIDEIGYPHNPKEILDKLIAQKAFRKTETGFYTFYLRSFLEYFIAKAMSQDAEFFNWIIDDSRYLTYVHEIEFFCGINPDRSDVLNIIASRHETMMQSLRSQSPIDLYKFDALELPKDEEGSLSVLNQQLALPALTQEERDERIDMELAVSRDQGAYRPAADTVDHRHFLSLTLYSSVFRNLEHLNKTEKETHMTALIQNWAEYLSVSFAIIPSIVKHRSMRINGVEYRVFSHSVMSDEQMARMLMLYLPTGVSAMMRSYLGSEKLLRQVEFKVDDQFPSIIKLVRSFLLSDLDQNDWISIASKMRVHLSDKRYLLLAMMWKLNSIIKLRDIKPDNSERIVDIIARIDADNSGKSGGEYNKIYANRKSSLEKSLRVKDMKNRIKKKKLEDTTIIIITGDNNTHSS